MQGYTGEAAAMGSMMGLKNRLAPIHCTGCFHLSRQAKFSHFKRELSSSSKEHEVMVFHINGCLLLSA
ncbi:hypothetical protein, partial [Desulfofundulus australicus]|uniref:hypothetical protein n=1 Tax=Desulfofundulus australicus TaxID=1566 RepID=UPI001A96AC7F